MLKEIICWEEPEGESMNYVCTWYDCLESIPVAPKQVRHCFMVMKHIEFTWSQKSLKVWEYQKNMEKVAKKEKAEKCQGIHGYSLTFLDVGGKHWPSFQQTNEVFSTKDTVNNVIILKKVPSLLKRIQNVYLPPFIFCFATLEPSGSIFSGVSGLWALSSPALSGLTLVLQEDLGNQVETVVQQRYLHLLWCGVSKKKKRLHSILKRGVAKD